LLDEPMNVPYDKREPCPTCGSRKRLYSQQLTAQVRATATLVPVFIASAAAGVYAAARIMVRPPSPEPGYHPPQKYGDVVGESILVAIGVAGLIAFGRGVRARFRTEPRFRL
jgi:hypothetical protein